MKKTFNIIKNIFTTLLLIVTVCVMIFTVVSVKTFDRNDRSIFGYKMSIVMSDSMSATDFNAGDLVLTKEVDPSTLMEGDIISYTSQNSENFGKTVTHKIRSLTVDEEGNPGFITYGTTTDTDDETIVTYPYVTGKYVKSIPKVGTFFNFLRTVPGYICFILIPFALLIIVQAANTVVLFRRYRSEQMEGIINEREQLARERAENAKVLAELKQMQEEMLAKN
jgi:signal peptidase